MKSLKKTILASALAVTLVGGIFAPKASAADATDAETWKGQTLKITKILQKVEKGVTTPDVNFEFALTPIGDKAADTPKIDNIKIPFTAADNTDADDAEPGIQVEKFGELDLSKIDWKEAGIYEYKLTEVIPDPGIKDMDYGYFINKGTYTKQYPSRYYIARFKVEKVGTELKVTGFTITSEYPKRTHKLNYDADKGVKFKNYYNKKDGNTPEPGGGTDITEADKKGFAFKKIVETTDSTDYNKSFEFAVKVDKPADSKSKDTGFSYVVVDEKGNVGDVQTGTYGTEFIVNLKTDQRVVFTDVILGSKVSVTENDPQGLTPSVKSDFFEKDDTASNDKTAVGIIGDTKGNYAEFTNKNEVIPPITGVLIDNLPYIALVAVAGLGIFFFVKNKREEEIYA